MSDEKPFETNDEQPVPDEQASTDDRPTGPVPDVEPAGSSPEPAPDTGPTDSSPEAAPESVGEAAERPSGEQTTKQLPPTEPYPPPGSAWTAADSGYGDAAASAAGPGGYEQTGYETPTSGYAGSGYAGSGYSGSGYASPGNAPPGYAADYGAGYAYAPPPRTDDKAVWALISAIGGFLLCPVVLHIVGWVLANQSLRAIEASRGRLTGDGMARTARVLSIIGLVLFGIVTLLAILFFAILIPLGLMTVGTVTNELDVQDTTVKVASVAEIDGRTFDHQVGEVRYDLSEVDFTDETADMTVSLGAGVLIVEVPDEVTVEVDAQVGVGEIDIFGQRADGFGLDRTITDEGDAEGGTLELDVSVNVGELEVSRD